jgi:hypothetical protein
VNRQNPPAPEDDHDNFENGFYIGPPKGHILHPDTIKQILDHKHKQAIKTYADRKTRD